MREDVHGPGGMHRVCPPRQAVKNSRVLRSVSANFNVILHEVYYRVFENIPFPPPLPVSPAGAELLRCVCTRTRLFTHATNASIRARHLVLYLPPFLLLHSPFFIPVMDCSNKSSLSLDTTGLGALAASSMVLVAGGLLATVRAAACRHTRRASMAV